MKFKLCQLKNYFGMLRRADADTTGIKAVTGYA
jgi:hypothetical protein